MMTIKKYLYPICIALIGFMFLTPNKSKAQDPHLAQYYAAPVHTNPAMIGVFPGQFRFNLNYREQWGTFINKAPFRTAAGSFDMRHQIGRGDYLSWGVNVLSDQVGEAKFQRNNGALGVSYMKQLSSNRYRSGDQYLVVGAQVGAGQNSIMGSKLWFSNQFDTETEQVDFNIDNGEGLNKMTDLYLDFNAGLLWYAVFDDNLSIYAGGAIHHLNSPKVTFYNEGNAGSIAMRWTGQVGGEIPLTRDLSLLPSVLVTGQGPSLKTIFGTNFRYTNRDWREVAVRAGVWGDVVNNYKSGLSFPSMIYSFILEMGRWNVGASYDVNMGALSTPTNSRGAFELSLIYIHPPKTRIRVKCPKL